MRNKSYLIVTTICVSLLFLILFPRTSDAYIDLSTYKLHTGKFSGEIEAKAALNKLHSETEWTGKYQTTGTYEDYYQIQSSEISDQGHAKNVLNQFTASTGIPAYYVGLGDKLLYYQLITGGFSGEETVKQILQSLENETGITGNYVGIGEKLDYYQIISGGFNGETTAKQILEQFKNSTGINASYVGLGEKLNYYQIISGGFSGQARTIEIMEQFKRETGIGAFYIGLGTPQSYYQLVSGGFSGEAATQNILQQFEKATGIKGSYVFIGNNRYQIISEPVLGIKQVNIGRDFFKSNNWSITYKDTGKVGYDRYQIKSVPVLGTDLVNKGRNFFKNNNWSVTYQATGQTAYERYQIISDPVLGLDLVNKGRNFFKSNNWSVTYKPTGQSGYARYQIISNPVLGLEQVNKGRRFFINNNWSITYKPTRLIGYEGYRVISKPVLGMTMVKKGQEFFKNNNLSAIYQATGNRLEQYQIVIEDIIGYENVRAANLKLNQMYGWIGTAIKTKVGPKLMYTNYGLSLNSMLDIQMTRSPQTDMYRNERRYVSAEFVDMSRQVITGNGVNLRTAPSIDSEIVQKLNSGDSVLVIGKTGDWVEVRVTWQNAKQEDVKSYLDPSNFSIDNTKDYFQFLKLSQSAQLNAAEVNDKILNGKGILAGKGQAFVDAAKKYNVNEVYLIAHALLETGNGTSKLANGIEVNGKTVYNMYGYGAIDSCPLTCGAQTAYDNGWFTPEAAIIGGAKFISEDYIYNPAFKQDTLYKMRWNPIAPWHQYATDISWAYKQVNSIYNIYQMLDNYTLYYDVPKYN
ncbi:glucosaminidase domain-containing protein [Neobacillus sp. 179-J 1A1 HS]|uniref:N-acetylglucosaminidase n=1 Tax=Neobacillus driksii TaxID=3035913 RepID=UPI0035BC135B